MVGWHHQLGEHEFEKAPGVGDGQGGLACCTPWSHKESDMTERLNNDICFLYYQILKICFLASQVSKFPTGEEKAFELLHFTETRGIVSLI